MDIFLRDHTTLPPIYEVLGAELNAHPSPSSKHNVPLRISIGQAYLEEFPRNRHQSAAPSDPFLCSSFVATNAALDNYGCQEIPQRQVTLDPLATARQFLEGPIDVGTIHELGKLLLEVIDLRMTPDHVRNLLSRVLEAMERKPAPENVSKLLFEALEAFDLKAILEHDPHDTLASELTPGVEGRHRLNVWKQSSLLVRHSNMPSSVGRRFRKNRPATGKKTASKPHKVVERDRRWKMNLELKRLKGEIPRVCFSSATSRTNTGDVAKVPIVSRGVKLVRALKAELSETDTKLTEAYDTLNNLEHDHERLQKAYGNVVCESMELQRKHSVDVWTGSVESGTAGKGGVLTRPPKSRLTSPKSTECSSTTINVESSEARPCAKRSPLSANDEDLKDTPQWLARTIARIDYEVNQSAPFTSEMDSSSGVED
ncbi:hypothetical protein MMC12_001729 [Toensbergia leucococca]|nr:hypothetical protein [Toensbergia leucococca]